MTNQITYRVALEVASHEAIVRRAYKDSKGIWTWSIGLTSASGHDVTRYIGKPQSIEHCLRIYVWALQRYADDVNEAFGGRILTEAQFAAALSFHYNTGAIKRASWVKHFLAGNIANAKTSFMQWNKPPEIVGRRKKEFELFFNGVWSNNGTITEYTKLTAVSTPVWSSAKKINIEVDLRNALSANEPSFSPPVNSSLEPEETKMPEPSTSTPTPVEQASKTVGAAKGSAQGSVLAGAIITLLLAFGVLPPELNTAEVGAAIGVVLTAISSGVLAAIQAYRAPPNAG